MIIPVINQQDVILKKQSNHWSEKENINVNTVCIYFIRAC